MAEPTPPGDKPPAKPAAPAARPGVKGKPGPAAKGASADAAPAPPAEPTMRAEIRARMRKGTPSRFEVVPAGTVLGRDTAAGVPIPLDGVSREHARIRWDGRGWWLEDLKSTNGTFVNGERVVREKLQHLDVISLGRKADLVFVLRSPDVVVPTTRKGVVRAALVEDDGTVHEIPVGEFTLGRSAACNVVAPETAISKVHARIQRSSDQVVLEDLGSSNGTFVNGARVRTAILREGDTLELANAARFKVTVETGQVHSSGIFRALPAKPEKQDEPQFSGDWKTRYEWDPAELAKIAAAAAGVRPPGMDRKVEPPAGPKHFVQGKAKPAPAPAPGAEKPVTAPASAGKPAAAGPIGAGKPGGAAPAVSGEPPSAAQPVPRPVKIDAPAGAAPAAPPEVAAKAPLPPGAEQAVTPTQRAAEPAPPPVVRMAVPPAEPAAPAVPPAPPPAAPPATPPAAPPAPVATAAPEAPPPEAPPPVAPAPPVAAPEVPRAKQTLVERARAMEEASATDASATMLTGTPVVPRSTVGSIKAARFTGKTMAFAVTEPGRYEMGRASGTALRVEHSTVSRRHAAVTLGPDRTTLILEDLGAANRTRVNGREIAGPVRLAEGDVVQLGEVELVVGLERG